MWRLLYYHYNSICIYTLLLYMQCMNKIHCNTNILVQQYIIHYIIIFSHVFVLIVLCFQTTISYKITFKSIMIIDVIIFYIFYLNTLALQQFEYHQFKTPSLEWYTFAVNLSIR